MDRTVWSLVLITVALQMVALTVAAPPDHLIPSLPGQPEVDFKQYGGYITVNQSDGRKLFYYFVEAEKSNATTPLVLWLNGGPGCSSLLGAFTELGPFQPNATGDGLIANNQSWNKVANIIFLESPAGVGFSYSNDTSDYSTDDEKTAQDSLAFLLGWLAQYPEYNSTDFYVTGESYGGHYVPQLAAAILKNNNIPGQVQILLKGIMVGNPLFEVTEDLGYSPIEYAWGHGMMSEAVHETILKECNFSAPYQSPACSAAVATANEQAISSSYLDPYDVLADVCLSGGGQASRLKAMHKGVLFTADPCIEDYLTSYLNLNAVESALHTEVSGWTPCSGTVQYNISSFSAPVTPLLTDLAKKNLTIWIYSGDADIVVPLIGTRKIVNGVAENLNLRIASDYAIWFQGSQIGGWSISWGSLVYSTVRGAGHMVPEFQPARALVLFSSFLAGNPTPPLNPH